MRNYYNWFTEYCLFYTFQNDNLTNSEFDSLRKYFKEILDHLGKNKTEIIQIIWQKADHCFR